jgi:hypothetical protein
MAIVLNDYFEALERLKKGTPKIVEKGSSINKDTVALEAGRKRGSIKKSRQIFTSLISAIKAAGTEVADIKDKEKMRAQRLRSKKGEYKKLYEQSLARELSLLHEIRGLKEEIYTLRSGSIKLVHKP